MTSEIVQLPARPDWIVDLDDIPHPPGQEALWNESMLVYVYSPETETGIYFHLRHVPGADASPGIWDVVIYITLRCGKCLVAKLFAPGEVVTGGDNLGRLTIGGFCWTWNKAFEKSRVQFRGAARLVDSAELRDGRLADGPHVSCNFDIEMSAISPPWDHWVPEQPEYSASYSKRFYAQHYHFDGCISYAGNDIAINGKGLRDHSWGPRDFLGMGYVTWIHGQMDSGRTFCITYCPATAYRPEMWDRKVGDAGAMYCTTMGNVPLARSFEEALVPTCEFELGNPNGTTSTVKVEILQQMYLNYMRPSEFGIGRVAAGDAASTHEAYPAFARIEWDGEIGYGYCERTVFIGTEE